MCIYVLNVMRNDGYCALHSYVRICHTMIASGSDHLKTEAKMRVNDSYPAPILPYCTMMIIKLVHLYIQHNSSYQATTPLISNAMYAFTSLQPYIQYNDSYQATPHIQCNVFYQGPNTHYIGTYIHTIVWMIMLKSFLLLGSTRET